MIKNRLICLFLALYGLFLTMDMYSGVIMRDCEKNLLNADIIGNWRGLPDGLSSSVAFQESSGKSIAICKNKTNEFSSFGVFQINEQFEKWFANKYLVGGYKNYNRNNPIHSTIMGTGYLLDLYRQFKNWNLVLCAYNWGPGNVLKTKNYSDIPFHVREYARKILSRIQKKENNLPETNNLSSCKKHLVRYMKIKECDDIKKYLFCEIFRYFIYGDVC